jgi:hypothetical protein
LAIFRELELDFFAPRSLFLIQPQQQQQQTGSAPELLVLFFFSFLA